MRVQHQVRVLLAVIAILVAVVLWQRSGNDNARAVLPFIAQVHAQGAAPATFDYMFFPVGNQDVRKMVFGDRRTNEIHIYSGGGKFEETWQIAALGQDLRRR